MDNKKKLEKEIAEKEKRNKELRDKLIPQAEKLLKDIANTEN